MLPDLKNELLLLDGATGSVLQHRGLKPGEIPELLNLNNPELLIDLHKEYIEAGSRVVYANTFGANAHKLAGSGHSVEEIIAAGVANAKKAAAGTETLVGLDAGPLGQLMEPSGPMSFEQAYEMYKEMFVAGEKAGADLIAIETMADLLETKAALLAAKENTDLPVFVTMTFETDGRTFTGTPIEAMAATLEGLGADAIGLNCSVGPDLMLPLLKRLRKATSLPIIAKPNAGLPDPVDGHYPMEADEFASIMKEAAQAGVSILGGCCGTTPAYIARLKEELRDVKSAYTAPEKKATVCSNTKVVHGDGVRVIGERINPTGKKRFQKALLEQDLDYILDVALEQQEAGADLLDVNVGFPGVDEAAMLPAVVKKLQGVIDLPLQLDSGDPAALEAALRIYNGVPSVNSVNATEKSMQTILPLVKKYGASVVGLTIDEDGIPKTAKKRVELAQKLKERAASLGISPERLWIDPLTLTVSAEPDQAVQTLQAVETITRELGLPTVLGVSNISFGLPARQTLASAFLVQALQAGLRFPIINPNQNQMMDMVAAFRVLHEEDPQAGAYIARFSGAEEKKPAAASGLHFSLEEAVERGLKKEAARLAREALASEDELHLVETRLIPALDRVGEGYEKGNLFLPQLLAAAQAAQSVFEVIRQSLAEKGQSEAKKGPIVLATVKGDIHDIGKNIVKTVLENYGFEVIDLGKDTDPQLVYDTVKEKNIRLVGLSALMTTTLPAMEETIALLQTLPEPPLIMVGGAVLTPEYAKKMKADFYAKDARESAEIAKRVFA